MNAAFAAVVDELYTATRPAMITRFTATLDCGAVVRVPGGSTREEIVELVYEAIDEQKQAGIEDQLDARHSDQGPPPQESDHAERY